MIQANWIYIVTATCILLAAFLVWNEVKRANKNYLLLRIASLLIATAMLACIALPIGYQTEVNQADQHRVILLTQGFDADSLTADKDSRMFTLEPSIKQAYSKATLLPGVDELADTVENVQLHIYGYGLAANDLQQMNKANLVFHPVAAPAGISSISWNAELKAGEVLHIQGSYNNSSAQKVKLILKGLNTVLDTVTVKPNAQASFHLSTLPKVTGKVVYILQTVLNGDTLTQGNVPVEISPVKPLSILMLTASPDFESRFLKNWLGQNGYAVALRSAISKDKFNTEFINMQQLPLSRLSASTLNRFDVVMGDLSVLNNLSGAEGAALKQEVADNGLGIIVRADSADKASWLQKSFPVDKPAGKEPAPSVLNINGEKSAAKQLGVPADHIVFQNGTQPLVTDAQNRILASSTLSGSGKLVFTTFNNTLSWMLGGNRQDYTALWSALINSAARKKITTQSDIATADIPFVNKPFVLQISQANASPLIINREQLAPVQNAAIPFEWNVSYWPKGAGWQLVNNTNWWYVYNADEWKGVQAAAKIAATNKYAKANSNADIVTKQIQQKVRIEIPKIYFYILLLVACTFLWIENKFS